MDDTWNVVWAAVALALLAVLLVVLGIVCLKCIRSCNSPGSGQGKCCLPWRRWSVKWVWRSVHL